MATVVYSFSTSLDGYIAGPDGSFGWSEPDEELHRFHNDEVRALRAHVLGRRLYETMAYWETADSTGADKPRHEHEFAHLWRALPKLVVSRTLDTVAGEQTRLATRSLAEEVALLRAQEGGEVAVGGASVGAACLALGLVDELRMYVCPVLTGGGTPFFGPLEREVGLELLATRTFMGGRVVHLRYRVQPAD